MTNLRSVNGDYSWPNRSLYNAFYAYRAVYEGLLQKGQRDHHSAFRDLCRRLTVDAVGLLNGYHALSQSAERRHPQETLAAFPLDPLHNWIQSLASLLATLAHLASEKGA